MEPELKLKREHFTRVDMDPHHYYYSFGVMGFEICLEPCAAGFDVAVYGKDKEMLAPRQCTNSEGYLESAGAMFGDRKDEDWGKALAIVNEMLDRHTVKEMEYVKDWLQSNQPANQQALITEDEITALKARAKRITMQDALRATMEGGFVLVIPMDLKSGYCVSYTIIENPPNQLEMFSVGAHGKPVDPADAEYLAKAVLHEYTVLGNLLSKGMTHFMKKVKE